MEKSKADKIVKNQKKVNVGRGVSKALSEKKSEIKSEKNTYIVKIPKFVWGFIIMVVILIILSIVGVIAFKKFTTVKKENHVALVEKQLSFCSELISGKYRYSDVISLKKKAGLARSYSIVKYSGIIRAGIRDISDITYEVDEKHNSIVIKVPPAELLGNEICSQEVFDEKHSIFVPITAKEIFQEIEVAKEEAVADIIAEGLLEESWEQASNVIRQFMYGCGFEDVRIVERR